MRRRVLGSFSGGRTSAKMVRLLQERWAGEADLLFVMANATQEDERTLIFADRCDREWGLGLVWVEAAVDPRHGAATGHRVVTFDTADRDGRAYEAVIAKYGIPNASYLHCNRELKLRPIHDYVQNAHGWEAGSYDTAIGIRADEADRQNSRAKEERLIYPLIKWGITKPDVIRWWRQQPFDLDVPEHLGNCKWCWKKTLRKHLTLAAEHPEVFDFPARMEAKYQFHGSNKDGQPRRFFRKNWTTLDIRVRAQRAFQPFREGVVYDDPDLDRAQGCSESCDIYADAPVERDLFGEAS